MPRSGKARSDFAFGFGPGLRHQSALPLTPDQSELEGRKEGAISFIQAAAIVTSPVGAVRFDPPAFYRNFRVKSEGRGKIISVVVILFFESTEVKRAGNFLRLFRRPGDSVALIRNCHLGGLSDCLLLFELGTCITVHGRLSPFSALYNIV